MRRIDDDAARAAIELALPTAGPAVGNPAACHRHCMYAEGMMACNSGVHLRYDEILAGATACSLRETANGHGAAAARDGPFAPG